MLSKAKHLISALESTLIFVGTLLLLIKDPKAKSQQILFPPSNFPTTTCTSFRHFLVLEFVSSIYP